jgi:hypothetical protein
MKRNSFLISGLLVFSVLKTTAQNFYDVNTIQQIEILFPISNWDYILDTAKMGSDTYTMATWVKINGTQFDSVGVKYKGNSSFNQNNAKNPLHIELDHFKNHDYFGIKDIKLSNGYHEPSSVREVLLYQIARNYLPSGYANFAQVYINGSPMGLYTNVEAVTNTYLESKYYSDNGTFVFGDNGGCNLKYKGADTTFYYAPYTMKSDFGWTNLRNLCDTLLNNINEIEKILDVDRALWMMAFTNVTVTLDSYIGQSTHNYYTYQDQNRRFNMILWDLNGGLGVFNKAIQGPSFTTAQMQTMSPTLHINDTTWPLVKGLLSIPMYKRMYIAHMRTITDENFADSSYYYSAMQLQSIIDTAVQNDPNSFYTHAQFISNMNSTIVDGPKIIPGITELMEARKAYLYNTTDFLQVPPQISNVLPSDTLPQLNSSVSISAAVTNANTVWLGYRYSVLEKFTRVQMFDDGLHNDGPAGDLVYGTSVSISDNVLHYYIYADNANAGMFSPERAEYEYYTLETEKSVVINEIMADNSTTMADAYGDFNDWVELYNNTNSLIDISGYYLSDDASQKNKWQFPGGSTIAPNGFLIVWTDKDTTQTVGLHANFKLSASGEGVILSNNFLSVIDETSFSMLATDLTHGRYPNGTGDFSILYPTFNAVNSSPVFVENNKFENENYLEVFPNPATETISVKTSDNAISFFRLYSFEGRELSNGYMTGKTTIDLSTYSSGVYFIKVGSSSVKFIIGH